MFGTRTFDGRPFDADYVSRRMRNEPVHEIIQIKGQSEVHPALAPNDEFANFEIFPITLKMGPEMTISRPAGSYVREALGVGLELDASGIGNPYHFSFIGSSDSHNSTSPIEEDNYHGKLPLIDGTPEQRLDIKPASEQHRGFGRILSAQGLAAVWATGNTREAIFDALRRGETYATSGPRIGLRVFGGWGYEQALLGDLAYLDKAYAGGVPMGGDLPARPADAGAPRLLIRAAKDPDGANLDRVQVIKGWLDAGGQRQEKIFEVAWSGDRVPDPATGKLPAVGSTVDVAAASYTNTIGAAALDVLWEDPEFDPATRAFYYVRVLEIPTPRWSTHDAAKLKVEAPAPAGAAGARVFLAVLVRAGRGVKRTRWTWATSASSSSSRERRDSMSSAATGVRPVGRDDDPPARYWQSSSPTERTVSTFPSRVPTVRHSRICLFHQIV